MKPSEIEGVTIAALLNEGRVILSGNPDVQTDARILIEHSTGLTRTRQLANPDAIVPPAQVERTRSAFLRRAAGEPIAYILGRRSFWQHDFIVSPATLIPRPETEHLVAWALEKISPNQSITLIDLGTGSGAIALSLACERPMAQVIGCDYSAAALRIAQANQAQIQPNAINPVRWLCGHWADMLAPRCADVIVSNPPYIAPDDPHLAQGDLRFEPRSALVAEGEGLDDYRAIIQQARRVLKPDGWLIFEHGYNQAESVQALLAAAGFTAIETRSDLAGVPRNTAAKIDLIGTI